MTGPVNWAGAMAVRSAVLAAVEGLRRAGLVGAPEEACVMLRLGGAAAETAGLVDSALIREVCRLGDVFFDVQEHGDGPLEVEVVGARSLRGDPGYVSCPRCRRPQAVDPGLGPNHDGLCDRCCRVLIQGYPDHPAAAPIRAALARQNAARRARWAGGGA